MRKLLTYMRGFGKECVLGPLFKLLEASQELLVPLVVAAIVDRGIAGGDRGYILRMCLVLVALGAVGLVFSITAQYFAARAAVGFVGKVRRALFAHIESLSYAELDRLGASAMITRMTSDMNQVQSGVNLTLRLLLRSPFVVFGAMVMAFTIDVQAALVFAAAIPLLSVVVFGIMLWCIPLYKRVQSRLDQVLGITRENLTGVRVIRAFCQEDQERQEFTRRNQSLTQIQKYVGRISALMNPITYVIINLAIVALVWVGALRVETGILTNGLVVALYNYMSQILVELVKLANLIINITKAVACGNRIQAVFDLRPSQIWTETAPQIPADAPAVELRGAALRYADGSRALENVTLTVQRGETVGIIGGTGAGKTSLVNLIPRFYDASQGEVLVDGVNVRDYPQAMLRQKIGVVPQRATLFQGTLRDNMRWGKGDATDAEIEEALAAAQAKEVADGKGGLDFQVAQGGKNLSGGQRQRFTIARALVGKPDILILDDSASALDFATDAALRKAIRGLENRPTVFIVSQRASSIQYADQIVVLDDGAVVGLGRHEELLRSCQVYQEIYDSQFRKEDRVHG